MSEMVGNPEAGNVITIPTQVGDISPDWVKMVINQYKIKHIQPPLAINAQVVNLNVHDAKVSSGDMSITCKIHAIVNSHGDLENYTFIAKILPADDPNRVYVFEANVFEKEISIYFELLPCLRQFCSDSMLKTFLSTNIPQCIYGSNNTDGAGVLVFECALQQGYSHPLDPEGLSLDQVLCAVSFMAKFHAIGSALISKKLKSIQLRHPYLLNNVYNSPLMIEGAKKLFDIYAEFLSCVPDQVELLDKFNLHCQGESGVTQMFSCMRRQVESPFNTIVHGELWEKNILFRDEEEDSLQCVVLDWKNAKIASATKDIAFFLLSSTSNKLRSDHLETILQNYFTTFCDSLEILQPELLQDPSLSFEHFYTDYKTSTKGAFMQSVCVLIQEMQHLESQLNQEDSKETRKTSVGSIGETLRVYERRALNLMNDKVLNETHFV